MTDTSDTAKKYDGPEKGGRRPTIDEKLAEIYEAEKKLLGQKKKKKTHGLIVIGAAATAHAANSAPMRDWLHRTWLNAPGRDREAVSIAVTSFDVTRPPSADDKPDQSTQPTGPAYPAGKPSVNGASASPKVGDPSAASGSTQQNSSRSTAPQSGGSASPT